MVLHRFSPFLFDSPFTCDHFICCVGELFDHGLDSWACILLPLTLFSAIGTGTKYSGHTDEMLIPCIGVLLSLY